MEQPSPSPLDDLSLDALRSLVKELAGKLAAQYAAIEYRRFPGPSPC
jgi:hypothetical protein